MGPGWVTADLEIEPTGYLVRDHPSLCKMPFYKMSGFVHFAHFDVRLFANYQAAQAIAIFQYSSRK
jgi:hypothetical protein